jgi:hypothetical protein
MESQQIYINGEKVHSFLPDRLSMYEIACIILKRVYTPQIFLVVLISVNSMIGMTKAQNDFVKSIQRIEKMRTSFGRFAFLTFCSHESLFVGEYNSLFPLFDVNTFDQKPKKQD